MNEKVTAPRRCDIGVLVSFIDASDSDLMSG